MTATTPTAATPTAISYIVEPCMVGRDATEAECRAFATALATALSDRWPDADIEVTVSMHTSGMKSCRIETDDRAFEDAIRDAVLSIAERVLCAM